MALLSRAACDIASKTVTGRSAKTLFMEIIFAKVLGGDQPPVLVGNPAAFQAMRWHFHRRLEALKKKLDIVPLTVSFRSTEAVLDAVDAIFAQAAAQAGVSLDGEPILHQAARMGHSGHVELWPLAEPLAREPDPEWRPPRERRAGDSPRERLAKLIARRIKAMLARGETIHPQRSKNA